MRICKAGNIEAIPHNLDYRVRVLVNQIGQIERIVLRVNLCRFNPPAGYRWTTTSIHKGVVMRYVRFLLISLFLILVLAACGGDTSTTTNTASTTAQPTTVPTTVSTPQPAHAGKTAAQIVQELKAKGLLIGEVFSYTAENDLNHLLGRPGQYTGKTEFIDTRLPASGDQGANI